MFLNPFWKRFVIVPSADGLSLSVVPHWGIYSHPPPEANGGGGSPDSCHAASSCFQFVYVHCRRLWTTDGTVAFVHLDGMEGGAPTTLNLQIVPLTVEAHFLPS